MPTKRSYRDACGTARALDAVGERWALMVVREMILGPKRFTDLRFALPGISSDILAARLTELEDAGIVRRGVLPPPAASKVYALTDRGLELEPVLEALGRWGAGCEDPPEGVGMSFDSHVLHMRTLFEPSRAEGLRTRIQLILDGRPFAAEVDGGTFSVVPGQLRDPDATWTVPIDELLAVLRGWAPIDPATVEGDLAATSHFTTLFPLPQEIAA